MILSYKLVDNKVNKVGFDFLVAELMYIHQFLIVGNAINTICKYYQAFTNAHAGELMYTQ